MLPCMRFLFLSNECMRFRFSSERLCLRFTDLLHLMFHGICCGSIFAWIPITFSMQISYVVLDLLLVCRIEVGCLGQLSISIFSVAL
jgi:hypothetical protein